MVTTQNSYMGTQTWGNAANQTRTGITSSYTETVHGEPNTSLLIPYTVVGCNQTQELACFHHGWEEPAQALHPGSPVPEQPITPVLFVWLISRTFLANKYYFSYTTNQPTILSAMAYQPSEQDNKRYISVALLLS